MTSVVVSERSKLAYVVLGTFIIVLAIFSACGLSWSARRVTYPPVAQHKNPLNSADSVYASYISIK